MKLVEIQDEALHLSRDERIKLVSMLLQSLEENIEEQWAKLARQRFDEIASDKIKPVSWEDLKLRVTG